MSLVRKKERGGGSGKTIADRPAPSSPPTATAPRQVKPVANHRKSVEFSAGTTQQKENPSNTRKGALKEPSSLTSRSTSRGRGLSARSNAQEESSNKPTREKSRQPIRERPTILKSGRAPEETAKKSAKEEEDATSALRWSTSSLPSNGEKGKKSSEHSIKRIISDMQRERRSRLSQQESSGVSASHDSIECFGDRFPPKRSTVNEPRKAPIAKEGPKPSVSDDTQNMVEDNRQLLDTVKGSIPEKVGNSSGKDDRVGFGEVEGLSNKAVNNFPSMLRERLAFLEGRVNQIASELKQAKEMLDIDNTETSKTMLSDIQLRISGIEKSMTYPALDDKTHLASLGDEAECVQSKFQQEDKFVLQHGSVVQKSSKSDDADYEGSDDPPKSDGIDTRSDFAQNQWKRDSHDSSDSMVGSLKKPVKRLNHQDLEDRLYPHQKLLKNRPSVQLSVLKTRVYLHDQLNENEYVQDVFDDRPTSPIDEDPIAAEFLTALKHKYSVVSEFESENNNTKSKSNESGYNVLEDAEIKPDAGFSISNGSGNASSHIALDVRTSAIGIGPDGNEPQLQCDENMDFDDQENKLEVVGNIEETEEITFDQLNQVSHKTSTAGWFVSEGESILLAHDDGCCSFHDIANSEEKAEYKAPYGLTPNIWGDCWLIRAAGSDGRSGKYVVAASAGCTLDSGFCSWDFYNKEIMAFHTESETFTSTSSTITPVLTGRNVLGRNFGFANVVPENQHWWYRPCGPLLVSTASAQKTVSIYDIRDGDPVMNWETQRDVTNMNYSSPLQWRNKGKVVVAETEAISLWDVNSLDPRPLLCVAFPGRKVSALHVHNTDAECSGGVRQRASSSEVEGNDGVFCTQDAINVLDFRLPSGVGLKIPTFGETGQSIFARGDSIFGGVVNTRFSSKAPVRCRVHQWSIRKGKPVCSYVFPESNAHSEQLSIAQVWGSFNLVMAINGNGLFIFDAYQEDCTQSGAHDHLRTKGMREVIGSDDLYCPSFDYSGSRILLVSKDRPACWRYWS